jgi:hypothetical protein
MCYFKLWHFHVIPPTSSHYPHFCYHLQVLSPLSLSSCHHPIIPSSSPFCYHLGALSPLSLSSCHCPIIPSSSPFCCHLGALSPLPLSSCHSPIISSSSPSFHIIVAMVLLTTMLCPLSLHHSPFFMLLS